MGLFGNYDGVRDLFDGGGAGGSGSEYFGGSHEDYREHYEAEHGAPDPNARSTHEQHVEDSEREGTVEEIITQIGSAAQSTGASQIDISISAGGSLGGAEINSDINLSIHFDDVNNFNETGVQLDIPNPADLDDVLQGFFSLGSASEVNAVSYDNDRGDRTTILVSGGGAEYLIVGGDSQENKFSGTNSADIYNGSSGDDLIYGGNGNDTLDGGNDDDVVFGGSGNDLIYGGDGNDRLFGVSGEDAVYGQGGDDIIFGGAGDDSLYGGHGSDLIRGLGGNDYIDAGNQGDTVYGGEGNDTVLGGNAQDYIHLGSGNDVFHDTSQTKGIGMDTVFAGVGHDKIYGGGGSDLYHGQGGNDTITGGVGNDTITGGYGNDNLNGNYNNDVLDGGRGNDILTGGAAADTFIFQDNFGTDRITDFSTSTSGEKIDLSDVSSITSYSDLRSNHLRQSGGDAIIDAGAENTIRIEDVTLSQLSADDFIF